MIPLDINEEEVLKKQIGGELMKCDCCGRIIRSEGLKWHHAGKCRILGYSDESCWVCGDTKDLRISVLRL